MFLLKKIFFFFGWKICNVSVMFLLLYVHVCVTRTGWKTRPRPKTVILAIKKSNQINQIQPGDLHGEAVHLQTQPWLAEETAEYLYLKDKKNVADLWRRPGRSDISSPGQETGCRNHSSDQRAVYCLLVVWSSCVVLPITVHIGLRCCCGGGGSSGGMVEVVDVGAGFFLSQQYMEYVSVSLTQFL